MVIACPVDGFPFYRLSPTGDLRKNALVGLAAGSVFLYINGASPAWESAAERWPIGEHPWWKIMPYAAAPLVVTSITDPYGDPQECYKIAATVWPASPAGR